MIGYPTTASQRLICLFSWLPQMRPHTDPRKRLKDLVKSDMKTTGIIEPMWDETVFHKVQWWRTYNEGVNEPQQTQQHQTINAPRDTKCSGCGRCFRRQNDQVKHKCAPELTRPVCEQEGAMRYDVCKR